MANPILVTGAAGRVGAVGRTVTELLLKQGKAVRAMVRKEDERAQPTLFLEGFFLTLTPDSVRQTNQIRLPFGDGKTSPVAVEDVARVVATLLANPQPHIGKIYHLTGPQSENMHFYAQEYSNALGRTITFQDIPVEPWGNALLERGWPVHVVNHLTVMADQHRAGRFDRMSDEVLMLTGQRPLSVQEFVRKNAATFTTQAPTMASA